MGVIDVHAHIVPREVLRSGAARWPSIDAGSDEATVTVDGRPFRIVRREAWDLELRRAKFETRRLDAQVVSPMPELFCVDLDAGTGAWWHAVNEWIADAVEAHQPHYYGLGIVPMQAPDLAAEMLTEVAQLGLRGIEVPTHVRGVSIADQRFRPLLAEAERLGLGVFVHAFHPRCEEDFESPLIANGVTFPLDIGLAVLSVVASGLLDQLPALRLCASHGGGAAPFTCGRLNAVYDAWAEVRNEIGRPPLEQLRTMWFDSLVFDRSSLEFLVAKVGPDRVVAGSDQPFFPKPEDWVHSDGLLDLLGEDQMNSNARAFLGVEAVAP